MLTCTHHTPLCVCWCQSQSIQGLSANPSFPPASLLLLSRHLIALSLSLTHPSHPTHADDLPFIRKATNTTGSSTPDSTSTQQQQEDDWQEGEAQRRVRAMRDKFVSLQPGAARGRGPLDGVKRGRGFDKKVRGAVLGQAGLRLLLLAMKRFQASNTAMAGMESLVPYVMECFCSKENDVYGEAARVLWRMQLIGRRNEALREAMQDNARQVANTILRYLHMTHTHTQSGLLSISLSLSLCVSPAHRLFETMSGAGQSSSSGDIIPTTTRLLASLLADPQSSKWFDPLNTQQQQQQQQQANGEGTKGRKRARQESEGERVMEGRALLSALLSQVRIRPPTHTYIHGAIWLTQATVDACVCVCRSRCP